MRDRTSFLTFHARRPAFVRRAPWILHSYVASTRKLLHLALAMVLAISTFFAQNVGKVAGQIRDAETGESLVGSNVTILGIPLGAFSDVERAFFILNIPPGKYDMQASLVGYQSVIQKGVIVNAGRTTTADFRLTPTDLKIGRAHV